MRVIVAEDTLLVREGISRVLRQASIDVVAELQDAGTLLREVALQQPDVAIVDIRMPPTHTDEGLVAARRIRLEHPATAVLVLSAFVEASYATDLLEGHPEGTGYLLKDRISDPAVLVDALLRVAEGETVVDPTIVATLFRRRRQGEPLAALTERERSVLGLVAEGMSNRGISARLQITERTVEAHIAAVFDKLGLTTSPTTNRRVLAALTFLRG